MNDYFLDENGRLVQREQCTIHGIYFVRKEDWYRWKLFEKETSFRVIPQMNSHSLFVVFLDAWWINKEDLE
jgi:hypothetical protein